MDTVDVVIGTYGDREKWGSLADRAALSAEKQTVQPGMVWRIHRDTLSVARNAGAARSNADWLIFLDADDELDPYYVERMLEVQGDIRQPSTLGVVAGIEDDFPVLIPPHPDGFMVGNHLVIGSMLRRELFMKVRGFLELPVWKTGPFHSHAACWSKARYVSRGHLPGARD